MTEKKQKNQEQEIVDSIGGHGGPAPCAQDPLAG